MKSISIDLERSFSKFPPGRIRIAATRKRTQFYFSQDLSEKNEVYVSKKNTATLRKYLQKSYNEKAYKLVNLEISCIESFLSQSANIHQKIRSLYSSYPQEVKTYVSPIDCSDEDIIKIWLSVPYEPNPMPVRTSEELKTDRGETVRSKSELNIANSLYRAGIPYKYECPVKLKDGKTVYPDFTILDIKNRRIIYWEHRGMMDDKEYVRESVSKIKAYAKSGIITGKNLIITEETLYTKLGTDEINAIIKSILE